MSEVLLPYAERADGRLVRVEEVERGAACECVCSECRAPVIARKGDILAHHFAHAASESCRNAIETTLHKLGKQIIRDAGWLWVPGYSIDSRPLIAATKVTATLVEIEKGIGQIRPDLLFHRHGHVLAVEIRVTNSPDIAKIAAFRALMQPAIEIDLSNVDRNSLEQLKSEYVLRDAPRAWIYHPTIDSAAAEDSCRRLEGLHPALVEWQRNAPDRIAWLKAERQRRERLTHSIGALQRIQGEISEQIAELLHAWPGPDILTGGDAVDA
jgi:Competence protein CoiA-like family